MKKVLGILCLTGLFMIGCGRTEIPAETVYAEETAAVSAAVETDAIVYVSLGDSIARGYGLSNIPEERFSTVAGQYWDTENLEIYNYGVDGQTSSELIAMLQDGGAERLTDADVVSISIGANNVLQSTWQFLYEYYVYLYADPPQFTDTEIAEQFQIFTDAADAGCELLEEDLPLLLDVIREINPDCQILFLTVYNPYEAVNTIMEIGGLPISLSALSDMYVTKINDCIRKGTASDEKIAIVDVYTAFAGRGRELVYAHSAEGQDPADLDMTRMDPHPNVKGHKVIGYLVSEAYPIA
ncbi:MAG: hypothetical protein IJX14_01525 [Clostridia bacterium]|nr:hypothetical protein [Clostridia bacterium]